MTTYDSTAAIADITRATYVELRRRFVELATVVDMVGAERQALASEMRIREQEAAARIRLGALTADKRVLYQSILDSQP